MGRSLCNSISRHPIPFDSDQAVNACSDLPSELAADAIADLLRGTAGSSPFLAKLISAHSEWLIKVCQTPSDAVINDLLADVNQHVEGADWSDLLSHLRRARARAALFIALCDLGGAWEFVDITGRLSDLADGLTSAALRWIVAKEIRRGKLPGVDESDLDTAAGLFIIAMGKMGAQELNYSSDIDLICLFDQDKFEATARGDARARFIHVIRTLVKALSDWTADGYVFRTDLRLRPTPSTTPVCMAMAAAENYYASIGRTWERAAHIKARTAAGDLQAGRRYLKNLAPFIWREPLDFPAIEDIEEILRKIRVKKGHFSLAAIPGCDIKLNPGGIREIELFVQTRQLITAGRLPSLREPTTLGALAALRDEGIITTTMCSSLSEIYVAHRTIEHRLQMIDDKQTQTIPKDENARSRVAALDGYGDREVWENEIAQRLAAVNQNTQEFFDASARVPTEREKFVLDQPTLSALGFENPETVLQIIRRWRDGSVAAMASENVQRLYESIEADIIKLLAKADAADAAVDAFDRFLSDLTNGRHVFSLLKANRHLIDDVIEILVTAPRLVNLLGRWPQTLDAHLDEAFFQQFPSQEWLAADLHIRIGETGHYERILEIVRIWARELRFRVSVHVLKGLIDEVSAGQAFTAIAEATLEALTPIVITEFTKRYGQSLGRGIGIVGMGKLGTREMTARSDLDLIVIYDDRHCADEEERRSAAGYFGRLTRNLITAFTADTAKGRLYNVDLRRRPSGNRGPIAVSLTTFEDHQIKQAGVWEHLALMRGRVVFGERELRQEIEQIIDQALSSRQQDEQVMSEARTLRELRIATHEEASPNPWLLMSNTGGLREIDFLAQTNGLYRGVGFGCSAREILPKIAGTKRLSSEDIDHLERAIAIQTRLQQIDCVARENDYNNSNERLRRVMALATGEEDYDMLSKTLKTVQAKVAGICSTAFFP
ncbi:MAG: bifunctional [glutamine synthetase] adenylyltransferase/[glutamine synthetase]-adenylyl-L-tyrosine phosphorylase [Aestuariivita sp.]|nr:bifunctional [glutamine synthetase] adenylyltransferase/[glutamine synthetase]-adenylyl-L-tyrosine phosphorylase [Aestuariivita sp.]MCY4203580.1 bifunctional [glutamine synthetase] adenylyltransferase/[glutamine synthetase]-adenylyl-L-tyrosine phosphorylase [Aestuariivita sp.]